jgi:hypothetical protein
VTGLPLLAPEMMAMLSLFFSVLAIVGQTVPLAQASSATLKVVNLGYATYQSDLSLEDGITSFLGVRYAAPPVGKHLQSLLGVSFA